MRLDLTDFISERLTLETALWAHDYRQAVLPFASSSMPVHVVPVPSIRAANRRRGGQLTTRLAHAVKDGLVACGIAARVQHSLRSSASSQKLLGVRTRGMNAAAGLQLTDKWQPGPFLLVDDVITTGATIATAARLLSAKGSQALGGIVLAHHLDPSVIGQQPEL